MFLSPFILLGVLVFAWAQDEQSAERKIVTGVVESWSRAQTQQGSGNYIIWATLENGEKVMVTGSSIGPAPNNGAQIEIVQSTRDSGRVSYRWNKSAKTGN